jgi:hypothetical protein
MIPISFTNLNRWSTTADKRDGTMALILLPEVAGVLTAMEQTVTLTFKLVVLRVMVKRVPKKSATIFPSRTWNRNPAIAPRSWDHNSTLKIVVSRRLHFVGTQLITLKQLDPSNGRNCRWCMSRSMRASERAAHRKLETENAQKTIGLPSEHHALHVLPGTRLVTAHSKRPVLNSVDYVALRITERERPGIALISVL